MTKELRVVDCRSISGLPFELELDEYVPIQFQTSNRPLGSGFLRLGDYDKTLLELEIEPRKQAIRGVTVVSVFELSNLPQIVPTQTVAGLPILDTGFDGWAVIDLKLNFQVGISDREIVVYWSDFSYPCRSMRFNNVDFLIQNERLSGIRFGELRADQMANFRSHFLKQRR